MKITAAHRTLWLLKKAPAFIRESLIPCTTTGSVWSQEREFDINAVIPDDFSRFYLDVANTLAVLRHKRKRGKDMFGAVSELAQSPVSNLKRRNTCRRLLRKMNAIRAVKYFNYQI